MWPPISVYGVSDGCPVDPFTDFRCDVLVFTQGGLAVFSELGNQFRNAAVINLIIREAGFHTQLFKENTGCFNGALIPALFGTVCQMPDSLSVLL